MPADVVPGAVCGGLALRALEPDLKVVEQYQEIMIHRFLKEMEDSMPWTNIARREHKRETDRYPSDLTDAEWLVIASLLPAAKSGGSKRTTELREVVNGILYIASSGCPWRMLPKDFPR